jgi:pimeloyl-ACP methyl ester carboxylesterase
VVAVALPLVVFLLQDQLIFFPQRSPPGAQSVFLDAADGTRLHARKIEPAAGAPLVVYFGGNAEEVSWMLDEARRRAPGVGWLLVDYRGYGASEGSPSEKALVADALRWFDHLGAHERIYVFGRSLGSGVAVQLAAARPVAGVILVTPFDSLVDVGQRHYPFLPVRWMLRHPFDSAARAPGIAAPLLCLVAARDEIIPPAHARRLFDAWKGAKRWVELDGAGHNSTDGAPTFWPAIREFLEKKHGTA